MSRFYRVVSNVEAEAALDRVKDLLTAEGVSFEQVGPTVRSTRTPIIILGIQPKLYSRRNWVGLNPFIFVSGVTIGTKVPDNKGTVVEISINRLRAYLLAMLWTILGFFVGKELPQPVGALLFFGIALLAWTGIVLFLGSHLVRGEICRAINQ